MKGIFIFLILVFTVPAFSSGCHTTYLEGTQTGWGKVPLYSAGLLGLSSLLLHSEGNIKDDKNKQEAASSGAILAGLYFYFAVHGWCRTIDKKEYDNLIEERKKLLAEGTPELKLPMRVRFIAPIPSEEEYKEQIQRWKKMQQKLVFIVGGVNAYQLYEVGRNADHDSTKAFAYTSMAVVIGMAIFDVDNLWNDKPPSWARFDVLAAQVDNTVTPKAQVSFSF